MIAFESPILETLLEDARQAFPDECCGFLFGTEDGENRYVSDILIVDNANEGDKRRRFEISPRDYLRAERYALKQGLSLLGVYHSHPSHPAVPSEHDRIAAQPYFSYVIVSVYDREIRDITSWRLNEEAQFEPETVDEALILQVDRG